MSLKPLAIWDLTSGYHLHSSELCSQPRKEHSAGPPPPTVPSYYELSHELAMRSEAARCRVGDPGSSDPCLWILCISGSFYLVLLFSRMHDSSVKQVWNSATVNRPTIADALCGPFLGPLRLGLEGEPCDPGRTSTWCYAHQLSLRLQIPVCSCLLTVWL